MASAPTAQVDAAHPRRGAGLRWRRAVRGLRIGTLARAALALFAIFPAQPCVAAGDQPAGGASEAVKREFASLQGRWRWNGSGATGPGNYAETRKFLEGGRTIVIGAGFNPDDFTVIVKGAEFRFGNGNPAGRATATIDPSTHPKQIDFRDANGRVWVGVYRLDGNALTIVVSSDGHRPGDDRSHHAREGSISLIRMTGAPK